MSKLIEQAIKLGAPYATLQRHLVSRYGMLELLLRCASDPKSMPLATSTKCFTSAMAIIVYPILGMGPCNMACKLQEHPRLDLRIGTPMYRVHILHLAPLGSYGLCLRPLRRQSLFMTLVTPLLRHTLLYVACLPLKECASSICVPWQHADPSKNLGISLR